MNFHQPHALISRIDTGQLLRRWTSLSRTTVLGGFLMGDLAVITAMSWLTGISYHLVVHQYAGDAVNYLKVGLLSAIVFVTANCFAASTACRISSSSSRMCAARSSSGT